MKEILFLSKVLIKNNFNLGINSKKSNKGSIAPKIVLGSLALICVLVLFVPFFGLSYLYGQLFLDSNIVDSYPILIIPFALITIIVFSILGIITTFFLSDDILYLISLPMKTRSILISKFIASLSSTYLIEACMLLPLLLGYGVGAHMGFLYFFNSFVIFILLPFIPNGIILLIITLLMSYTPASKIKDKIQYFAMVISIVLAILLNLFMNKLNPDSALPIDLINNLSSSLAKVFFFIKPAFMSLSSNIINQIIGLVLFVIEALGIFYICALVSEKNYLKSVICKPQIKKKRKEKAEKKIELKDSSLFKTLIINDYKMITRSPVFNLNLVLINVIMPLIMIGAFLLANGDSLTLLLNSKNYLTFDNSISFLITIMICLFISSFSFTASTSFSREGKGMSYYKLLPIPFSKIVLAKVALAFLLSLISFISIIVLLLFILGIKGILYIFLVIATLAPIVLFEQYIGVLLDLYMPRLKWSSEQEAVKNNINTFFQFIFDFLVIIILCLILVSVFLLQKVITVYIPLLALIIIIIFSLLCLLINSIIKKNSSKLFNKIN